MIKIFRGIYLEFSSLLYNFIRYYPDTHLGHFFRKTYWSKKLRNSGKNLTIRQGSGLGFPHLIDIGNNFILGNSSLITANSSHGVYIGNNVSIARNVVIHSANHSFDDLNAPIMEQKVKVPKIEFNNSYYSVVIEDDVWIGSGSIILPGTKIHKGCVISSGSVVKGDFSEFTVIMGNPARVIKSRKL